MGYEGLYSLGLNIFLRIIIYLLAKRNIIICLIDFLDKVKSNTVQDK